MMPRELKVMLLVAAVALCLGAAIEPDVVLIGADADALGKVFAYGDLDGDGRDDWFVSGCGP